MSEERGPGVEHRLTVATVSQYLGHGLTWAISTLLFLWLGLQADGWLGTEPWLTLLGAFVGAGAGFYHMIHRLVLLPREREREKARERERGREAGGELNDGFGRDR